MEALEHLHRQLEGLEDLRDIVGTMKALSAASVRQYEHAAEALADYYRTVELALHAALRGVGTEPLGELTAPAKTDRHGLVVFCSDHGLCGRFNEDVVAHADESVSAGGWRKEDCQVLAVGARAAGTLERYGFDVARELFLPGTASLITHTVQQLLPILDEWRHRDGVSVISLVYNHPLQRRVGYSPAIVRLLPIDLNRFEHLEREPWPTRNIPGFSVSRRTLLVALMRQYFFVMLSRACADSLAAEHNSRLAAMQAAEKNLDDQFEETMTRYRRARQEMITAELLDVVTGFQVITGDAAENQ